MKKILSLMAVFVMAFALAIPASAYDFGFTDNNGFGDYGDKTSEMETYHAEGYTYFTMMSDGTGTKYMMQSTQPMFQNNVNLYINASESCKYVLYSAYKEGDGLIWKYSKSGTLAKGQAWSSNMDTVHWASYDLFDNVGNLVVGGDDGFFPQPPLAELVLEVTEGELVEVTIPNLVGALKILVPCGVGLMALLVGLKLFGKRSLISRS